MPNHTLAPGEASLQLDVPFLLPGVDDPQDGCVNRLEERLRGQTGIKNVHLDRDGLNRVVLCLHYDPNLVSLDKVNRLARDEGTSITQRFKHEAIPVKGMDCASCAASIEHVVRKIPGVMSVSVFYPTQKMRVEWDSEQTNREAIVKAVSRLGYRILDKKSPLISLTTREPEHRHEGHDHEGHDHEGHDHDHGDHEGHDHAHHDHDEHDHSAHKAEKTEEHGHDHHDHLGHSHDDGDTDPNAHWTKRYPALTRSLISGAFLLVAFVGQVTGILPVWAYLPLYAASYFAGGYDLARHTVPTTLSGRLDVEFLMLLGAIGAAILHDYAEGAFLLFLFSLGHALENFALGRARDALGALGKIMPRTARVRRDNTEREIPLEELAVGDTVIVRAGERVAVDGSIIKGRSSLDQSALTGESVPVERGEGESVLAGSLNGDGALEVQVGKLAQDTTLSRVITMVEEAQAQKAPSQTFADRFEKILVPTILSVAFFAAIIPPLVGRLTWSDSLLRAISAIVAASPCALALATPAAVLAGIARAAQRGVLIKGGVYLENLGTLCAIAFDKTGTLTKGRPEVAAVWTAPSLSQNDLLQLAASLESRSSHPLARAIMDAATKANLPLATTGEVQTIPGRGLRAQVEADEVLIGNAALLNENHIEIPAEAHQQLQQWGEQGRPTMLVARGGRTIGAFAFADPLRDDAKSTIAALQKLGVSELVMLSGDNARVAASVASAVGITQTRADLLPADKVTAINALLSEHKMVAMIGDGVNDAPALATATVGVAMGASGTDVALETADVALLSDDLGKLPFAVALSRQSKSIIRQNLWISLGVICLLVPSTLFGLAPLGVAIIFHEGSTLLVVLNALRLLRFDMAK
ncbi:cadmium-transporting ATPase [Abditibacteriota bacterium]|nr:cadmium-transporting ATPase [Abditibacteriota bacterium]